MNLPRLSLARVAGGRAFFSSVVITGGHVASLDRLDERSIDMCSIDSVTWGFFEKYRPVESDRYRILDETASSPSLPYVTAVTTSESDAAAIAATLHEIMVDSRMGGIRDALELAGFSTPEVDAYERLAEFEREAADLGYPELK
jgi:ABC-type phosphate/phosphonate transport system substrate-binding protein